MQHDKNLQFIVDKIEDIQVARFHCTSNSLLKIPSTVIHTYKVSNNGEILFYLPKPTQLISQFDKDFTVDLHYFRKGGAGYLNISGKARILNDPEELCEYDLTYQEIERSLTKDILVVVKVMKADYHLSQPLNTNSLFKKLKLVVYGLLAWVEPNRKSYDFSKSQIHNYGF